MMRMIFLVAFVFSSGAASAQVLIAILFGEKLNTDKLEFGLAVSPTFSNISGVSGSTKSGLGLSLYFNIKLGEDLFLHPEASPKAVFGAKGIAPYSTGDGTIDTLFMNGGSVERKIKALSVPLLLRYRIKGLLFAEAGPQINLMTSAKDVFERKVNENDLSYSTDIKDHLTKFDVGLAAGLEYKFKKDKGLGLGLRYYNGFTDIIKTGSGTQRNSAWLINISIPIGSNKASAKANEAAK